MGERRRIETPAAIAAYTLAGLAAALLVRLLIPLQAPPLKLYWAAWRLVEGLDLFIYLYPSLLLSALVVPFGFGEHSSVEGGRFSPVFLASMRKPLLGAIAAAALYALLSLLVRPLLQDAHADMTFRGRLFTEAKAQVAVYAEKKLWREAANHLALCERIWPQSPETEALRDAVNLGLEELRNTLAGGLAAVSAETVPRNEGLGLPGAEVWSLSAADALAQAQEAFKGGRYYDAHWLAGMASRLARKGGPEEAGAASLASKAWEAVASLEPDASDLQAYSLYRRKRDGYTALQSGDWVRSYYIYKELSTILPQDPDVLKYLALAEKGTTEIAFFADEVSRSLGDVTGAAVLSLPLRSETGSRTGTALLSFDSLAVFDDVSYGTDLFIRMYDGEGRATGSVRTAYAKLLPFTLDPIGTDGIKASGRARTLALLTALDRTDQTLRWTPSWSDSRTATADRAQIILDIPYEDLRLALHAKKGPGALSAGELQRAGQVLGDYGFFPKTFQGELIRRFYNPLNFLVLCILAIAVGWRLRSRRGAGAVGIPMVALLPLAFDTVVQSFRMVAELISLWLILALPFISALLVIFGVGSLLFFFALVFLAGQRG